MIQDVKSLLSVEVNGYEVNGYKGVNAKGLSGLEAVGYRGLLRGGPLSFRDIVAEEQLRSSNKGFFDDRINDISNKKALESKTAVSGADRGVDNRGVDNRGVDNRGVDRKGIDNERGPEGKLDGKLTGERGEREEVGDAVSKEGNGGVKGGVWKKERAEEGVEKGAIKAVEKFLETNKGMGLRGWLGMKEGIADGIKGNKIKIKEGQEDNANEGEWGIEGNTLLIIGKLLDDLEVLAKRVPTDGNVKGLFEDLKVLLEKISKEGIDLREGLLLEKSKLGELEKLLKALSDVEVFKRGGFGKLLSELDNRVKELLEKVFQNGAKEGFVKREGFVKWEVMEKRGGHEVRQGVQIDEKAVKASIVEDGLGVEKRASEGVVKEEFVYMGKGEGGNISRGFRGEVLSNKYEPTIEESKQLFEQVIKKAQGVIGRGRSEVRIQLEPRLFGNITLKLQMENGVVSGHFNVDNVHVKKLLEDNISLLRESLEGQGIKLSGLDIRYTGADRGAGGGVGRESILGAVGDVKNVVLEGSNEDEDAIMDRYNGFDFISKEVNIIV